MRICVYCGSSDGMSPAFRTTAADVGTRLVARGIGVVYGGGKQLKGLCAEQGWHWFPERVELRRDGSDG